MTETIATRYGAVEIVSHSDAVWTDGMQRRRCSSQYELTWDGKRYEAFAAANWDSPYGSRDWHVERLFRVTMLPGRGARLPLRKTSVVVPRNQRAWLAVVEAIHEHRRLHGYAPRPGGPPGAEGTGTMTPSEAKSPVGITVYRPDGTSQAMVIDLPELPDIYDLREVISPLIGGAYPEHVTVLHGGCRADLFVGEFSADGSLPRNDAATSIYRNGWISQHPEDDPEGLPAIYGPAVIFSRRVWF